MLDKDSLNELQQILFEDYAQSLELDQTALVGDHLLRMFEPLFSQEINIDKYETKRIQTITP